MSKRSKWKSTAIRWSVTAAGLVALVAELGAGKKWH
jgi:hypothetical protein